jgi:hypothetical protein
VRPAAPATTANLSTNANTPPAPRLELGVQASAGVLLGPAPPVFGDIFLGWLGGLGIALRTRAGALALAEFRVGGRLDDPARLVRLRVALGGGYSWRLDRLELATALLLFVEPWFVRPGDGVLMTAEEPASPGAFPPVLGATLALSAGYRVTLARGRALRVGPRVEVAGGFVLGEDGPTVAGVSVREQGQLVPRFRLGGLELFSGLELVVWFDVSGRSARPRTELGRAK